MSQKKACTSVENSPSITHRMRLDEHHAASPTETTTDKRGSDSHDQHEPSSSWTMELSRWRVRLRRLKRWSRYEGRASDGQFNTADLPDDEDAEGLPGAKPPVRKRHSLTSAESVRFDPNRFASYTARCQYEPVVPPVCIPSTYRLQDKQRGVRVGGDRVPFTLDGHMRRRKMVRPLMRIEESEPLALLGLPDMRNSMAMASVYACQARSRSRRAASV